MLTFGILFAGPTDAAQALSGGRSQQALSVEMLRERLGLDRPIHEQYLTYLGNLLRGDMGESYYFGSPVSWKRSLQRFPGYAATGPGHLHPGGGAGGATGRRLDLDVRGLLDRTDASGLVAISIPSFLFGLLLLYFFAFRLKLFPVGGYGSSAHLSCRR